MSIGHAIKNWITEHGRESAIGNFNELVATGRIKARDVSFRDLAENIVGPGWAAQMQRSLDSPMTSPFLNPDLYRGQESGDAVSASSFASITGNLLIDRIRAGWDAPGMIGDQLVETIPVTHGNLDTIKEPWLGDIGNAPSLLTSLTDDDEDILEEGEPISADDFAGNYVLLARPKKRGRACYVTFEMIYSDRTRQAYQRAESVGKRLRRSKEYRILKVLAGITNNYTFSHNNATEATACTYIETNASTNPAYLSGRGWVNHLDSTPLVNWNDLNSVEQLFNRMLDPNTGEPIDVEANTIVVMPGNVHNARHILFSTQIRTGPGGSTSTSNAASTVNYSSSDLKQYNLLSSKYLYKLMTSGLSIPSQDYFNSSNGGTTLTVTAAQAADFWWVGNFPKAFYYREVYPLRTFQAPPMNPKEFERDIVLSVGAREFGVAGVQDPRYVARCAGHAFESQTD